MSLPPRKPTMRDVSRLAGVSRMTVSRLLSQPSLVQPATRARVEAAIDALGYVPDRVAGALATKRSGFVGLVLPTLTNANFAAMAEGLDGALAPHGYQLLIGYTNYAASEEERAIRALLSRRPEAIAVTGAAHGRAAAALLAGAGMPVVELADLSGHAMHARVGFSNHAVGRAAAEALIRLGHRRIAALGPGRGGERSVERRDTRGEERMAGFTEALAQAGLATDLVLSDGAPPISFAHGAASLRTVLARAPDVEAVFAVSDLSATGALMECRRQGIDIPGRLSLLGFGDFEVARQLVPALSTIAVDFDRLGCCAGRLILSLLGRSPAREATIVDIGFRLVERETTRRFPTPPLAVHGPAPP